MAVRLHLAELQREGGGHTQPVVLPHAPPKADTAGTPAWLTLLRQLRALLRMACALTMTSSALLVDMLLGFSLLLLNLVVAALCEVLALATRRVVNIDGWWYRWLHTTKDSVSASQVERALANLA